MQILSKILFKSRLVVENLYFSLFSNSKRDIVANFHKLYYDSGHQGKTWGSSKYMGINVQKFPGDLLVYQEIIVEQKPDLIIETGTAFGGTTLFMAHICDALGTGKVVSVDIEKQGDPPIHPRITYILGSSTSPDVIEQISHLAKGQSKVMVILDSNHTMSHVLTELELYKDFVTPDSYLIVEDTNVNGNPVYPEHGPGPSEALKTFLADNSQFIVDRSREKHLISFNPGGYLRKKI